MANEATFDENILDDESAMFLVDQAADEIELAEDDLMLGLAEFDSEESLIVDTDEAIGTYYTDLDQLPDDNQ